MRAMFAALVAGALTLFTGAAEAHGPTRQKVEITIDVAAPAAKTWAVVSNFQDLSWLAPVTKLEGTGGSDIGAERTLTLANGEVVKEKLEKFDPTKMMLFYRMDGDNIKALPVTNYSSRLTVKSVDDTHSTITWWGAFYRGFPNNDPPPELSDAAAIKAVTDLYNLGLGALKTKIESGK
ncbi:SRPBCC family protein [Oryzibacter oryziterrae]|uniref:SRPBCC family protein n=1 Tax=Oryzibacter oryziterrae TaxID=2766474 RepID=UPI001F28F156|nr:SRPBCC family protein [Oryzibacter oryziterrae]